ncbi:hypothetical protein [Desulfosporosinus sp. SB140]|uniref:hypothetical protein n=1 Tax=Desulfosporosinus paludis TaxID=3115649 RepID=UPI00388D3864
MNLKGNKGSKQPTDSQLAPHDHKNSPNSNTTGKARDAITPAKDKSPDDLEILD